jgi:hypothetical protein
LFLPIEIFSSTENPAPEPRATDPRANDQFSGPIFWPAQRSERTSAQLIRLPEPIFTNPEQHNSASGKFPDAGRATTIERKIGSQCEQNSGSVLAGNLSNYC